MSRKITVVAIVFVSLIFASTFLIVDSVQAQVLLNSANSGYKMTISYQISGEGSPKPPTIDYVDLKGNHLSKTIPVSPTTLELTMGKNRAWSVTPNPLDGSSSSERWYSTNSLSGKTPNNGGSATIIFTFQHQYKIEFTVNPYNSGTTSPSGTNWYDSTQPLNIVATKKDSYTFTSWTKTGSISISDPTSSITTATFSGYGTITANFAKPKDTTLTVSAYPKTVDKIGDQVTTITGKLTSYGQGVEGKLIALMFNSGNGDKPAGTATTDVNGDYIYDWNPNDQLPNGLYIIKAFFAGDTSFKASNAATSCRGDITVIPEYLLGGLAALGACFLGFAVFKKRNSLPHFKKL
jgi:hypothetical protein